MPGLVSKGPRILELDPANFLLDDPHSLYPPCISPLTPTKHKACRPSHLHASWMLNHDSAKCGGGGGGDIARQNSDGDHDLAAMVHDFIENGTRDRDQCDSDGDNASGSSINKLCDNLKVLAVSNSPSESELLSKITSLLLSLEEDSISCVDEPSHECKGACFRSSVVKRLKSMGYDAAICKLKWEISGNVPGGDYEYVDVLLGSSSAGEQQLRLILDLDFRSQFEIARPTQHYRAALKLLPTVFLGPVARLHQILEIMSEAAKCSLSQNSLHLPPWRTIEYLFAKWLSPHERSSKVVPLGPPGSKENEDSQSKPCWEQVRRIKEGLRADSNENCSSASAASSQKRGRRGIFLPRRNKTNKW